MINSNIDILDTVDTIDSWTRDMMGILTILQLATYDYHPANHNHEAEESVNWVICNTMRGVIGSMKQLSAAMNEILRAQRKNQAKEVL